MAAHPQPARAGTSLPTALPRARRAVSALAALLVLSGCSSINQVTSALGLTGSGPRPGEPGYVTGFAGAVASEDPRAALVARDILAAGGSAADAAVAAGLVMTVTLPSRAGLGGGGACLVFDPRRGTTDAIVFPAAAPAQNAPGADRPAAVPLMARGLYAVHARMGRLPFEQMVAPAEQLARFGAQVSPTLAADLATVGPSLLVDPRSRAVFEGATGTGAQIVQPDLATTLGRLRTLGVGDFHQGALAQRIAEASVAAGGGLRVADLRDALPRLTTPINVAVGNDVASFLPPPADGGLAAAAAFNALRAGASPAAAQNTALSVAAGARAGGDPATLLANPPAGGSTGALPASTSLTVADPDGGAVSCAFSMNNLFGTGRTLPGLGFLLAPAPRGAIAPPLLSAVLVSNSNVKAFRYAGAGSGQEAAPMAVAVPMVPSLAGRGILRDALAAAPEPARGVAIGCPGYLPTEPTSCQAAVDPRGGGLAVVNRGN
ncbi:gamma-glutamyltransferase [Roseomonas elaeocarpi]|uniref:Gamma-glutamyltransferase n=1 Tax=Roseomonas elaeocarpi TaxID=907779 RepID=A0ABV6JSL5_9PROT